MKSMKIFMYVFISVAFLASGCKSMNKTQKGAVIGTAGGAVIGGVIGKATGSTATGAVIGAVVGGAAGAIIGRQMDKQAEEMKEVLGDAEVKRVGEGIVVEFKEKILFAFNSSDLSAAARTNLDKLSAVLKKYPDTNIEVLGHTDNKGTEEYNLALSQRRAKAVSDYLLSTGVATSRITMKGLGESDPKVSNDTEEGRSENRRVEFVITANQKMIDDAKKEAGQ